MLPISHGHGNHFLRNGDSENVRTPIKFHRVFITRWLLPASSVRKNNISGWVNPHNPRGIGRKVLRYPLMWPLRKSPYSFMPLSSRKNRDKGNQTGKNYKLTQRRPGEPSLELPSSFPAIGWKQRLPLRQQQFKEVNLPNSLLGKKAAFHPSEHAEQGK